MARTLNFEGMIPHLILKVKQSSDQIGTIPCPRFIQIVIKKRIYWPYPAYRWIRTVTGVTVLIKIISSLWFSLLINT